MSQVLACATALGSGAGLAHLTHADAQHAHRGPVSTHALLTTTQGVAHRLASAESDPTVTSETASLPVGLAPPPPDPFGEHLRDGMVMTGATPHRLLLLTFDDGPELRTTPTVLDTLDEYGIKAPTTLRRGGTPRSAPLRVPHAMRATTATRSAAVCPRTRWRDPRTATGALSS
jgi:hypothetical protein